MTTSTNSPLKASLPTAIGAGRDLGVPSTAPRRQASKTAGLHIAFLAPKLYPVLCADDRSGFVGGAEVQQAAQIQGLMARGYRISVLTGDFGQPDRVQRQGVDIWRLPNENGRGWPGLRYVYPRLWDRVARLASLNPDIVFVQTASEELTSAAVFARLWRKHLVFAGASDTDFQLGSLPGMPEHHARLYRWALQKADAVIVQNMEQLRNLARHYGLSGQLVTNGLDDPLALPARRLGHVLWAATLKPLKQAHLFVELAREHPERRFVLVGGPDGSAASAAIAQTLAQDAQDLPNLTLTGHVPYHEVGRHFDGASVFVNTSTYEGLPNAFVQAWLRGTPTLSFVRPESAPGDVGTLACGDLDEMKRRLSALLIDPGTWQLASDGCRAHYLRHHTLREATQRYDQIFRTVVKAPA
jgi:glycosyltransferase involved in cell wall biosynthesis